MVYTLTISPSLDYHVVLDRFEKGTLNRTVRESMCVGGKGINVSIVLNELGVPTTATGFVSGFTGMEIEHQLEKKGIRSHFIRVNGHNSRINVKIHDIESESEINAQGPMINTDAIHQLMEFFHQLEKDDYLVLAGSIQKNMSANLYKDIMKVIGLKKVNTVVDTEGMLLKNTITENPFLIKPNVHELGDLFGVKITNKDEAVRYAKKLQIAGVRNVIVSMGKDGAVLVDENGMVHSHDALKPSTPEKEIQNRSTIGAGDSMVAGFLAGYIQTSDYENAFMLGLAAGSATAASDELGKRENIMDIYRKSK